MKLLNSNFYKLISHQNGNMEIYGIFDSYSVYQVSEMVQAFFINAQFEGPKPEHGIEEIDLTKAMKNRRRLGWPVGVDGWYDFTTSVSIVPRTFPSPDCHGAACEGHLV